jgi:hypothetical protein
MKMTIHFNNQEIATISANSTDIGLRAVRVVIGADENQAAKLLKFQLARVDNICSMNGYVIRKVEDAETRQERQERLITAYTKELEAAGWYVGERNPKRNKKFEGKFMVCEDPEFSGESDDATTTGFCIVGNELSNLIALAIECLEEAKGGTR